MKKFFLLLFLFVGCNWCSDIPERWFISSATITLLDDSDAVIGDTEVETDTLNIQYNAMLDFVEFSPQKFTPFGQSLYAFSCDDPGNKGTSDAIESFVFTSSKTYNGISPGESLNGFFTEEVPQFNSEPEYQTIEEWIVESNTLQGSLSFFGSSNAVINFISTQKPNNGELHILTITCTLHSGSVITASSPEFQWE